MGHSGFSELDGMFDDLQRQAIDDAHEHFAQDVAATARENGMDSADDIDIEVESKPDEGQRAIDVERVRRRANDLLGGGGPGET